MIWWLVLLLNFWKIVVSAKLEASSIDHKSGRRLHIAISTEKMKRLSFLSNALWVSFNRNTKLKTISLIWNVNRYRVYFWLPFPINSLYFKIRKNQKTKALPVTRISYKGHLTCSTHRLMVPKARKLFRIILINSFIKIGRGKLRWVDRKVIEDEMLC